MESKAVFIIEDDAEVRSCYLEALEMEGFNVASAINGKDALDKLSAMDNEELPGCIFLDLKMPVMDGRTFLNTIEKENHNSIAQIPIIVVSANGNLQEIDLRPAIEKLNKPLDIDDMYRLAHQYCDTQHTQYYH